MVDPERGRRERRGGVRREGEREREKEGEDMPSFHFITLSLTWFIGSLKLVMSPARNVDFSSSERAL